ncbi:hypothetical protein RHSIM_Rhsim06G0096700 [Rhododendron simsii]|uniref:Uncharacterized protein n=1 Tax=Rhododendron simsii TaxID=118357 RepID=A0A834GR73_RHOSS|nr:hypothetical protein RHSIM_Rhsim06G0096700 [Rhododendron simsii]
MATTIDDFSFPTTTNPPPLFIGSPPLWHRTSSTPSPHKETQRKSPKEDDEGESCNSKKEKSINRKERKSFSYVEQGPKAAQEGRGWRNGEEKMDLLWEDFNEELSRIQGSDCKNYEVSPGRGAANQFACVQGKRLLKSGGGTVCSVKRPGVVVFMKVLKRVFLLHSSHRTVKKRTW